MGRALQSLSSVRERLGAAVLDALRGRDPPHARGAADWRRRNDCMMSCYRNASATMRLSADYVIRLEEVDEKTSELPGVPIWRANRPEQVPVPLATLQ